MTSKRYTIALILLALVSACSQKEETPPPTPSDAARPATTTPPPDAAAPARPPAPDAAAPPPAAVKPQHVAAADAIGTWFTTIKTAAEGSSGDCPGMARALEGVGAKGKPVVDRAKKAQAALKKDPAAAQWLKDYTSTIMQNGFADVMEAVGDCAEHPAVKKAIMGLAR